MASHRDIFQKMQALLKGHQRLAVVGKRSNKWEILFKKPEEDWDFAEGSLRYRVTELAQKEKEPLIILDSTKDDRFVASADPEFRSALCFPVILPGKKQLTIFVEEPEHSMAFSLAVLPAWKELADQLEDLQPAPPPKVAAPMAPVPPAPKKPKDDGDDGDDGTPAAPKEQVNWLSVMVFLVFVVGGLGYGIMGFLRSQWESQLAGCTTNLASIVAASNMYARDHGGKYPKTLDEMVGKYMLDLPICPAAGRNTYSDLQYTKNPPGMSVSCSGGYHRKLFKGSGNPEHWPAMESTPPAARKNH